MTLTKLPKIKPARLTTSPITARILNAQAHPWPVHNPKASMNAKNPNIRRRAAKGSSSNPKPGYIPNPKIAIAKK
jgi:hypothetical protein